MKLIQYRFGETAQYQSTLIGEAIGSFFAQNDDLDLRAIHSDPSRGAKVADCLCDTALIARIAKTSFMESYSRFIDYSKARYLKSSFSCRFVFFEDDGLVRICYARDDEILTFDGIQNTFEDISRYLIDTDLFDNI